jgi:hypothetical protein
MDINFYLAQQLGPQPCWEMVALVYERELNAVAVDYRTVTRSIRQMAESFRIALHKSSHGFSQISAPVDLCIVLLGKTEKIGIHHCGIYWQGSVLHAMPGITLYEPMSVIEDRFDLIEFWAKPAAPP